MYNPFSLQGKTILITGASSGIGRATAIECSKMGAAVIITGRNKMRLEETCSLMEGDGHSVQVSDLSDEREIDKLVETIPHINGLVNNAGKTVQSLVQFVNHSSIDDIFKINTVAPILLTQKILKQKKISKGGSIVFTGSISGTSVVGGGNSLYSSSKGAIHGFMMNAALELAAKNIRVNEVCPGMIETHILEDGNITNEDLLLEKKRYPLKRFGKPEEVAFGIIYLLSDASLFVTGSSLVIDGGFTLQ